MRRILHAAAALVLLLVLAGAALWLARVPLAEHFLEQRLARAGFADATFEIESFGWRRLVIAPLALGPGPAPAAERLGLAFRPLRLLRGDIAHLELTVHGLRAGVVRGDEGPVLAGWPGADAQAGTAPSPGRAGAALGAVPTLHLRDARVTLESPVGQWIATVDADVEGGRAGPAAARIDAGLRNNRLVVDGELSARYDGSRIEGSARLRENDGFDVQLRGRVAEPLGDARARLSYEIDMPAAADLPWPFLPGAPPTAGRMALTGTAEGGIGTRPPPAAPAEWLARLVDGGWQGEYRLQAEDLAMASRFEDLDLRANGAWRSDGGRLSVATDGDGRLRIGRVAEALWSRLAPPRLVDTYVDAPVRVRWEPGDWLHLQPSPAGDGVRATVLPRATVDWPERPGRVTLQARVRADAGGQGRARLSVSEASLDGRGLRVADTALARVAVVGGVDDLLGAPEGELDVSVDAPAVERGGIAAGDVALRLPLRITAGEGAPRVVLREDGLLRAGELALPGHLRAAEGVAADITEAALRAGDDPGYALRLAVPSFRLEATDPAAPIEAVEIAGTQARATGSADAPGPVEVRVARLEVPGRQVRARELSLQYRPAEPARWLDFAVGRIDDTGEAVRFAPVNLSGRVERRPDGLVIAGEGRAGDGAVPFRLDGRAASGGRSGRVAIVVPPVRFRPGELQPAALAPALGRLERVDGEARGSVALEWRGSEVDGSAIARLAGVDFTVGAARVTGLAGDVRLDSLRPPRTGTPQRLEAEAIDAGVRVAGPTLEFSVEGGGAGSVIHVVDARGGVVEGRVAVRDWRFDPFAQVYDPVLDVEGVSLARLLDRLSIDGLEGAGTLSGALPVSIAPAGIAVRDGRLRGVDGTLRYRSERADEVLADADRSVELMLRALENFRYDRIEIGVKRELEGESRIDIRMQGRNPDVLEGHPFDFNIALTGDVQPLLDALAQGRELTDELIERHLRMQQ